MKPLQRHIILTGSGHAGKTTVGEALACLLHRPFIKPENKALMEALSGQESVIVMDEEPVDPLHREILRFHTLVHMAPSGDSGYNRLAHIVVRDEGTPGEVAHRIAARLQ